MLDKLDPQVRDALKVDMVVDITTTGRNSGLPRRIEIWAQNLDGQVIITGSPGKRGWYANLLSNPEFTFHLKREVKADLAAIARPVADAAERRAIFAKIKEISRWTQRQALDVEEWVNGSCLVEVSFKG